MLVAKLNQFVNLFDRKIVINPCFSRILGIRTPTLWGPGVEPGAQICVQGAQGIPGYMRDTLKIKRAYQQLLILLCPL